MKFLYRDGLPKVFTLTGLIRMIALSLYHTLEKQKMPVRIRLWSTRLRHLKENPVSVWENILQILQEFCLTFVPVFVAIDIVGVLPLLLPLTEGMTDYDRSRVMRLAMITALGLGLGFVVVGKGIFLFMGIKVADFLVAGGVILFLLAARDILTGKMLSEEDLKGTGVLGAVPLGTPLIVGPAVLTTLLILIEEYPVYMVVLSFIVNLAIVWLVISRVSRVMAFLGQAGAKVISRIIALFLAAIAVKMISQGIMEILK
jgi:multiple antibiotic resistance protein